MTATDQILTVHQVLSLGADALALTSTSPRLDSELLLRHVLGLSQSGLILAFPEPCANEARYRFLELIERRKKREPLAYIVGEREFWGLSFCVTPDVLVPRPESELLVAEVAKASSKRREVHLLDLGTGSGCLAIALVKELIRLGCNKVTCDAVDLSQAALEIAQRNAERHGVSSLIHFSQGFWCRDLTRLATPYDFIVANPPYIDPQEETPIELSYEPRGALFSDQHGLGDTAEILSTALPLLKPGGALLCEVGAGKAGLIQGVVERALEAAGGEYNFEVSYLGDISAERDFFRVVWVGRRG
jgi:release factor glutamine methyltransferase